MRTRIAIAFCLAAAACGGSSPTKPSGPQLTERIVTAHFDFRYSAGDRVDAAWQEAYYEWAIAQLGVTPPVIRYNKYTGREQMGAITGNGNTNGYAEPGTNVIHTIWPTDNHEVVHIYSNPWGMPVALFSEGLAVAHQMNPYAGDYVAKWSGTPLHELARRFRAAGQLPAIAAIAETNGFRSRDPNTAYPVSGSFCRFLIDTEGMARMRQLFAELRPDSPLGTVQSAFLRVYGFTLEEAETRWLAFLA